MKNKTAEIINLHAREIANAATALHYSQNPELAERYGEKGREKCLQDAMYHISYLTEAILASSMNLFREYVGWAQQMLASRNIPSEDLATNLNCIKEVLAQRLPIENYIFAAKYLNSALSQLTEEVEGKTTFLEGDAPLADIAEEFLHLLLNGQRQLASKLILDAVENKVTVHDLYLNVFQPVQYEVGRLWQINEISVAQEHYCTASTQLIMSQLYPYIFSEKKNGKKLIATCIAGDLHEVGLRMVADFFEMEGWDTFYLGANTPVPSIINTIKDQQPDIVLVSATMAYHVRAIDELIKQIRADDTIAATKVIVGGYPFNTAPELWKEIKADGYASNAKHAIKSANELIG